MPNLVFASGVLMPQKIAGLAYFKDLADHYPPQTTLFAPVSSLGSAALRAQQLASAIAAKFPAGEIHIVAHSMGGLDARCLLARNLQGLASAGRVVSLSTISTPHHGSPVADLLLGEPAGLEFPFNHFLDQFASANAHALVDLSTKGAPGFSEKDPVPGIRYFAYAGKGLGSAQLFPTHVYVKTLQGDNDGLVSVQSATWPDRLAEPPWDTDHFGEMGYDLNRPDLTTPFPYLDAYARVVERATAQAAAT
nr:lipase/esterase [uncultured bacterium]